MQYLTIFLALIFLSFESASIFGPKLQPWENVVLIIRKHALGDLQLTTKLNPVYKVYSLFEDVLASLDKMIHIIPSWIRLHWWDERLVYVFVSLPIVLLLTISFPVFRKQKAILFWLALLLFWLVPVVNLTTNAWDSVVIKTHWDWKNPWSKSLVWIWRNADDTNISYTSFRYRWKQNYQTSIAKVLISCLGDYQLLVNGKSAYHGPNYAVPPRIYYDQVDIKNNIRTGENEIVVICNYSNKKYHQHATYPSPGFLVGGSIKDGWITRNLADNRLWQTAPNNGWKNGERLSQDAGYSENQDLTRDIEKKWETPQKLDFKEYVLEPRPIPLLVEKVETINELKSGIYDLGRTTVGYLTAIGNLNQDCAVSIAWGDKLVSSQKVQGNSQFDIIHFPKGEINWEQFSRRAGRYIQIKSECVKDFKLGFRTVGMPFIEPKIPKFSQEIDTQIYRLGINTLRNNVQDHFEDSIVREKAMYVGDAREMSRCLMADGQNGPLVHEMVKQFSQAQNKAGSLPAMAPSGNSVVIFDYVFQWVVWVNDYVQKSKDIVFAKEMWATIEKVMTWAKTYESPRGFVANSSDTNWWIFIDWSPTDRSKQFVTALQIWYYQALRSAGSIAKMANLPGDKYLQKADRLLTNLTEYGFNSKTGLFVDSFSTEERSKGENLATNALAGWSEIFPAGKSKTAIKNFQGKLITGVPFSESWVIEWLIKADNKDLALKTMRAYWGGMVNDGATAIYETYTPGSSGEITSYSHAWGCGPVYLYKEILKP